MMERRHEGGVVGCWSRRDEWVEEVCVVGEWVIVLAV